MMSHFGLEEALASNSRMRARNSDDEEVIAELQRERTLITIVGDLLNYDKEDRQEILQRVQEMLSLGTKVVDEETD